MHAYLIKIKLFIKFRYFLEFLYTCIQRLLCSAPVHCSGFILDIWSGSIFQSMFLYNTIIIIVALILSSYLLQ